MSIGMIDDPMPCGQLECECCAYWNATVEYESLPIPENRTVTCDGCGAIWISSLESNIVAAIFPCLKCGKRVVVREEKKNGS